MPVSTPADNLRHACAGLCSTSAGRLKGTLLGVKSVPCMPLSVEGQAHRLIEEASSKENLGMMYIWCVCAPLGERGSGGLLAGVH